MTTLKFYKYSAIGLLLLNLAFLLWFFLTAPKPHPPPGPKNESAVEILKLDDQQHELFLEFVERHKGKMDELDNQQRSLLASYFKTKFSFQDNQNIDSIFNKVQVVEQKKIQSTYEHLKEIESILRPEQSADFELFVDHALKMILNKKKKPGPPPKVFG